MLKANHITNEQKQYLINLSSTHITNSEIVKMFDHYYDRTTKKMMEPMFQPFDIFTVDKGDLHCIHSQMETTVGSFLFNKYIIDGTGLHTHIHYINEPMNGKDLEKLGDKVASLYANKKIDVEVVDKFLTVRDIFLSMVYQAILPSLTENILKVQPEIEKMAAELTEKYKKEIEAGDLVTMNMITDTLVNFARDLLQDDDAMILYQSGGKPEFSNNYRVLSIMRGPIKNEQTGKYEFMTSNLTSGIRKEDIPNSSNTILAGEYATAIGTQRFGYESKKILFFMNGETIGEKDSDCRSKATLPMVATRDLANEYRYFVEGDKLLQLTPENISQYNGKTLHFRSPMCCCRSNGPCNICVGDYPYRIGIHNIGTMASKISGVLLNQSTKSKHDLSYKTNMINITD